MTVSRFLAAPRPDGEVVALLERALESARNGQLRTVMIVSVDPIHETETQFAGELCRTRRTVLLGAMSRAANTLICTD